jgi:hypothetical protein
MCKIQKKKDYLIRNSIGGTEVEIQRDFGIWKRNNEIRNSVEITNLAT